MLILTLIACLTETSFPEQFAEERYRVDVTDDAALRYGSDPDATCDEEGDYVADDSDREEREAFYASLMEPCTFDDEAAQECLHELRAINTCEDALEALRASAGDVGHYLFASCAQACGVALED